MLDLDVRDARPDKGVFVRSCWQPNRDPAAPAKRFSDDGARVFDRTLCCWVAVGKPVDRHGRVVHADEPRGASAIPRHDGSGTWWEARCDGQPLWTIEAWSFDAALVEKRRLCDISGYSGRSIHLVEV